MIQPKDVEEEENPPPGRSAHHLESHKIDLAIVELREDLEHERDSRYALSDTVRQHRKDRETERVKDRTVYTVAKLQVERDVLSLVEELETARIEISCLNGDISSLRIQPDRLEHERKRLIVWSASARA